MSSLRRLLTTIFAITVIADPIPPSKPTFASPQTTQIPTPFVKVENLELAKRQQAPFSDSYNIAHDVDPQFWTIVNQYTTSYIGSNSLALSTRVVSVEGAGTSTVSAQLGVYTGIVNGENEYSFFLGPELAHDVAQILLGSSPKLAARQNPASDLNVTLEGLFALHAALSWGTIIKPAGPGLTSSTAMGVSVAGLLISGFEVIGLLAATFSQIKLLSKIEFPIGVKVDFNQGCPPDLQCSSCSGRNSLCTSSFNFRCPCEPVKKCPIDMLDPNYPKPFCDEDRCKGDERWLCTVGDLKDCPCNLPTDVFLDPWINDYEQQTQVMQGILDSHQPAAQPTCNNNDVKAVEMPANFERGMSIIGMRDLFYAMREKICQVCGNVDGFSNEAVQVQGWKGDSDCEISIWVTNDVLAYFYAGQNNTAQQQQCWDTTEAMIQSCWTEGYSDWTATGPGANQVYAGGFRSISDADPYATTQLTMSQVGTSATAPMPRPTQTSDPSKPSQLACYNGKPKPFRSFIETQSKQPIADYCMQKQAELNRGDRSTIDLTFNLDPSKDAINSDSLLEIEVLIGDCVPVGDFENQCRSTLEWIVNTCEYGNEIKWGGTATWQCAGYKINGINKQSTTPYY